MPISKMQLRSLLWSGATFRKGETYQKKGRVAIVSDNMGEGNTHEIHALVTGDRGLQYHTFVRMDANDQKVLKCKCSCPAFETYPGPCKHIVATILEAIKASTAQQLSLTSPSFISTEKHKPGSADHTDPQAKWLMRRYAQRSATQALAGSNEEPAILEPTLTVDRLGPKLSLRIGVKRLYIVKSIRKFMNYLQTGAEVKYGSQFTFKHVLGNFSESSRPLAHFILEQNHEPFENSYYSYSNYNSERYLRLSPYMLDEFMKFSAGGKLLIAQNNKSLRVSVRRENPQLSVDIQKGKQSDYKLKLIPGIKLLFGMDGLYILYKGIFYCSDQAYKNACSDFLKTLYLNPNNLTVGKDSMKALVSTVLNEISPFITVHSDEDLAVFKPLPLVTKIYLDMPQPNMVTAMMKFCYGKEEHNAFRPKKVTESLDLKGELFAESILKKYFQQQEVRGGILEINSDEGAIYRLVSNGVSELSSFAEVYATDSFRKIKVHSPMTANIGIRMKSDLLEVDFSLGSLNRSEMLEVLRSYQKNRKYHRLRDGSFLDLENDSLGELSELIDGLNLSSREIESGKALVPKYRSLYIDTLLKQSESKKYDRDVEFKRIIRDMKDVSDADFEVPPSLKPILRNYQKTGYRWLRMLAVYGFGGILADDMGLGKTIQMLSVLLAQKREKGEHTLSLVICPSSLVLNWKEEAGRFVPELQVTAVTGTAAVRAGILMNCQDADLLVTSYDSLKRDLAYYDKLKFEYEVIDEAQYIKNYSTQNAKSVKAIKSHIHFALTGTPVENSLSELWSIFDFLMPGYLFAYSKFKNKLEAPIVNSNDAGSQKELQNLIQPFILRRMKKDVLKELPEKTETVLYAEMQEQQKKLYLANVALTKGLLKQEPVHKESGKSRLQILSMLTRLRQICCDPALVYKNYNGESTKLKLCMELIDNCINSGHKLLLFSQFTSMLKIIEQRLKTLGIKYFQLTGATKASERLKIVNEFNADQTPVFLISLKAGGTGLNLTGADVVIHYDPWWNLSVQDQATDRAHRIGQKHSVQVYKLIVKNTLEEKILKMQRDKASLADKIIQEGGKSLAKMSREEIISLFDID